MSWILPYLEFLSLSVQSMTVNEWQ